MHGRSSENRIIKLIAKYIHAVKNEFRQFSRPLRGIGAIHFLYSILDFEINYLPNTLSNS